MIIAGFDLGTNYIRVVTKDGLVFNGKCLVALDHQNNCLAIGKDANKYLNMEDQGVYVISPLTPSNIQMDALSVLLDQLCSNFSLFRIFQKTNFVVSYPTNLSEKHLNDLENIFISLGAHKVYLEKEIWVAALGSKMNLFLPTASCILNIGDTNCDIATFVSGALLSNRSMNIAGKQISNAIYLYFRHQHNIQLSDYTIERIKKDLSQSYIQKSPQEMGIIGINLINGHNIYYKVNENMLVSIITPYIHQWALWIQDYISTLHPSYRNDIYQNGIICYGGSVRIKGFQKKLSYELGFPVHLTDDPFNTVSNGLTVIMKVIATDAK